MENLEERLYLAPGKRVDGLDSLMEQPLIVGFEGGIDLASIAVAYT